MITFSHVQVEGMDFPESTLVKIMKIVNSYYGGKIGYALLRIYYYLFFGYPKETNFDKHHIHWNENRISKS